MKSWLTSESSKATNQLHSFAGDIAVRSLLDSNLQGAHCEERLRIEIVNLREQLDTRAEENGLCFMSFIIIKGFS